VLVGGAAWLALLLVAASFTIPIMRTEVVANRAAATAP
jgi:hypothetical protein